VTYEEVRKWCYGEMRALSDTPMYQRGADILKLLDELREDRDEWKKRAESAEHARGGQMIYGIKATRQNGRSFYDGGIDGGIDYASSVGTYLEIEAAPPSFGACAAGIHVSPTGLAACRASNGIDGSEQVPWRFFELAIDPGDIVWPQRPVRPDDAKWRCRRALVVRELSHSDVFGEAISARVRDVQALVATFALIPWLRPTREVADEEVEMLISRWRERITVYLPANRAPLASAVRVVRYCYAASSAAAAAAAAAAAEDSYAFTDCHSAADLAVARTTGYEATNAAYSADSYDFGAKDADLDLGRLFGPLVWYVSPLSVMRRHARWMLAGLPAETDPWAPLVGLWRLGCLPLGYVQGELVVYVPSPRQS
jgi:hypothetical protein